MNLPLHSFLVRISKQFKLHTNTLVTLETDYIGQLNIVLSNLTNLFFLPIAEQLARHTFTKTTANDQKQEDLALSDFRRAFDKKIATLLAPAAKECTATILLNLLRASGSGLQGSVLHHFLTLVQRIFPKNSDEVKMFAQQLLQQRYDPAPLRDPLKPLIECLISAIQEVALATPGTYYSNISVTVPNEVQAALDTLLVSIEYLRRRYELKVRKLVDTSIELNMEIARADKEGYSWLPIRSLVTAPLEGEDLYLYARSNEDVTQLAYQLIRNNGVFLITGYRGVGKSTFINQALALCQKLEQNQREVLPWHIIPITISLARASSTTYILRLCIRKLYETLMITAYRAWLTKDEQRYLQFAYYRSVYKVSMQKESNVETLKHLEAQLGWSIKFGGGLLAGINPIVPSLLPNVDTNAKISRDDSNKLGSTIALLDYDEDKAEEDIIILIRMLAYHELSGNRKMRIKLAFIFDEIDKMKVEEQEALIGQLKNLFLARNAVFLLVTSKEFYLYMAGRTEERGYGAIKLFQRCKNGAFVYIQRDNDVIKTADPA